MNEELIDLMAESGLYQITFAIESAVQRVLTELIRKPLDIKKTKHLIKYTKSAGVSVHGFFVIGMPPMFGNKGETIEDMYETLRFAQECEFDSASFFTATPIIGSELLSECIRQGFIDDHIELYKMTYKQGLVSVPGLWSGTQVAELAVQFNQEINKNDNRIVKRKWNKLQY